MSDQSALRIGRIRIGIRAGFSIQRIPEIPKIRLADCLPGGFPLGPAVDPVVDPGSCGNYAADLPDS